MKDKILVPTVITTLILLIIFMLVCIIQQTYFTRQSEVFISDFAKELKEMRADMAKVKIDTVIAETKLKEAQKDIEALKLNRYPIF